MVGVRGVSDALQDGLDKWERVERRVATPSTNQGLMNMGLVTSAGEALFHVNRVRHETCGFHCGEPLRAITVNWSGETKHALIGHDCMHCWRLEECDDCLLLP